MSAATSLDPPAAERFAVRLTASKLALALIAVALTVRLIGLSARPLWLDEAYSTWFSAQSWHVLWTEVPRYEPHPPFYYSLLKLWRTAFGGSAVALRSFSVLLGAATVPLVFAATLELERQHPTGRPTLRAGIAAFLAACSPMLVLLGQEARPYPLLVFAYALATLGLLRLFREFDYGPGRWSSWLMLVSGTELGLWAHGLGLLYAFCLAAAVFPAWLKPPFDRGRLVRGIAAAALAGMFYSPCLVMVANRAGDWSGHGWLSWDPAMTLQLLSLYAVPVEVLTIGSAVAALVMLLLAKRAVQDGLASRGWTSERAVLVLWWGPPLIAITVSQLGMPIFLTRTLAGTLIPAYLALAGALARAHSPRERLVLTAALVVTLLPSTVEVAFRPASESWDEVAAYLQRNVGAADEVWLYPNDSALPLREAGAKGALRGIPRDYPAIGFKGPIRAGSPAVVSLTAAQAKDVVGYPHVREIHTIWLVTRQSTLFDPAGDVSRALRQVRRAGRLQQWGYITVQPYSLK
jgi:4-amino-4-deoxy-L-arabinose transferase-like glycosyltransferase